MKRTPELLKELSEVYENIKEHGFKVSTTIEIWAAKNGIRRSTAFEWLKALKGINGQKGL